MTLIELVATVFGIAGVVLTVRRNVLCWPVGLVQVGLYLWVFYEAKLYSDVLLHAVYVVLCLYGWWAWTRRRGAGAGSVRGGPGALPVTRLGGRRVAAWFGVGTAGTLVLGTLMTA